MTGIKTPAEMRKLAEAATKWSSIADMQMFRDACSRDQIIHDANLIEAQARRIEELTKQLSAYKGAISWLTQPFVTDDTPEGELRNRVRFAVEDAARADRAAGEAP